MLRYLDLPNGQRLCYTITNESSLDQEAITLVHGNFSSLGWWQETINGLKDLDKKIIAVDLRGFGHSSYFNKCYQFGEWAKDIVQLLNILKVKKTIIIGWSFGGAVSHKVCEIAPQLITKMIPTCAVSNQGLPMKDKQGNFIKNVEEIVAHPKIAFTLNLLEKKDVVAMRNIFDAVLYQKMDNISQQIKTKLALDPFDQRCYPEVLTALANPDINLELIKAKTLFIHGSNDIVVPLQTILQGVSKLGKLDLWEGHGHMVPLQDPERYIKAVKNFILN